jgi:hypothetical protein
MLPLESEVMTEIGTKYRTQLDAMTGLYDAVVEMIAAGSWTIRKPGFNRVVAKTMMGLLDESV